MIALVTLTSLHLVAGIALSARLGFETRSERALAASIIAVITILAPIEALGWLELLHRELLAAVSFALALVVLGGALAGRGSADRARALRAELLSTVSLPIDAVRETYRARSVALLGVLASGGVLLWTLWLAWLAPSGAWDGLWYHEPMVAFALQNHGFAEVSLPSEFAWINGYPRTSENLMLWACALSDRRLIDGVPSVVAPIALLAFYVLARRAGARKTVALGLGAVLLYVPGVVLQLRSTYIDLTVLAAFLAALAFVTRPQFDLRALWLTGLSLAFLGGTKATGLFYLAMLGAVGVVRLSIETVRRRSGWPLAHFVLALAPIALIAAPAYVRNLIEHDNPIWPLRYQSALLGITLEGPHDLSNMQLPWPDVAKELWGAPAPGQDYHDTRRHAYGYAATFVALPLFAVALVTSFVALARRKDRTRNLALLWLTLGLGAMTLVMSPAYYWARYALPAPAVGLVMVGWLLERRWWRGLGEGLLGAMLALSFVTLAWAEPGWDVPYETAMRLASQPRSGRVLAQVSLNLWPQLSTALREERLGDGDVVVFARGITFIGNLWNEELSNRVEWVPFRGRGAYLAELRRLDAKWVVAVRDTPEELALRDPSSGYREIGSGNREELVYERSSQQ
ncbi:MAG: hypothetical protein IT378_17770 [Sandaracinaceae bacterium]|nr:hypothetical protein [Sandaracinaceae bacterium]